MEIKIEQNLFKRLVEGCRRVVSQDDSRPALRFIKLTVLPNKVIGYSCNGYAASKAEIKTETGADKEYTLYIKPIQVKSFDTQMFYVTLELNEDGSTSVETHTEYGKVKYTFEKPSSAYFDVEKVYSDNEAHDREVTLDAVLVKKAIESIIASGEPGKKLFVFESNDNPVKPVVLTSEYEWGVVKQLVLPVRDNRKEKKA